VSGLAPRLAVLAALRAGTAVGCRDRVFIFAGERLLQRQYVDVETGAV